MTAILSVPASQNGEKNPLETVDLYVQVPFSFIVCGANNLSGHLIKTSPLFLHSSPSFHFPGFTALERQTGDRCTSFLNRLKEVLTSSLLGSSWSGFPSQPLKNSRNRIQLPEFICTYYLSTVAAFTENIFLL